MKAQKSSETAEAHLVYEGMIGAFFGQKPETELMEFLHPDFLGYGTASHEFFTSPEAVLEMARVQTAQLRKQEFTFTRKPVSEKFLAGGVICLIVEEFELYMQENDHRLSLRLTTLLEKNGGKWQVSHFHGSTPDSDIAENEAFPEEGLRKKNAELEAKIRERTRELEVEAALERVRTRTMAMQDSGELQSVIQEVFDQFTNLGFRLDHTGFILDYKERDDMHIWLADPNGPLVEITFPYFDSPHWNSFLQARKDGASLFTNNIDFETKNKFYSDLFDRIPEIPESSREIYFNSPGLAISTVLMDTVGLYIENLSGTPYTREENEILLRFGKVFQQAYTRFQDLQKAENQAREAEIELALERVRAQAMAMRHSDDLAQSTLIVFEELEKLNLSIERSGIGIFNAETRDCELWTTVVGKDGEKELATGITSLTVHPMLEATFAAWEAQKPLSYVLEGKELADYYDRVSTSEFVLSEEAIVKSASLAREFYNYAPFGAGGLYFFSDSEPISDDLKIMRRFAEVFDLTYTRFQDLQKAEAQAREAQIEAALERVRARSMAMHNSDELNDVLSVFFQQFDVLGIKPVSAFLSLFDIQNNTFTYRSTSKAGNRMQTQQVVDLDSLDLWREMAEKWKNEKQDAVEVIYYPAEVLPQLFELFEETFSAMPVSERLSVDDFPEGGYAVHGYCKFGYIGYNHHRPPTEEEKNILIRFSREFARLYQRFLDVKKAEEQAREAQVEAALERIRTQATAMQESTDLLDIVVTMRSEFVKLGHEAHYFWHMRWLPDKYDKAMTSGDGTRIGNVMELPRHMHGEIPELAAWEKSDSPTLVYTMVAEGAISYVDKMVDLGDFKQVDPHAPSHDDIRHIGGLTFVMARTTHGEIGYSLPGEVPEPPSEDLETLVRFAGVFDLAYRRFEDLKESERQRREAEIELALERVRARTMAMQHSDELAEASHLLDQQIRDLGIETWGCAFQIYRENDSMEWFSSEAGLMDAYPVPRENIFKRYYEKGQHGKKLYKDSFEGEACRKHYEYLCTLPVLGDLLKGILAAGGSFPEKQYDYVAYFRYGHVLFITLNPVGPEEEKVFVRFAEVFDQTYTRFLDLELKEQQAVALNAEKQRLEKTLQELQATQVQLIHSEKMASLGELTAGIAHEIQNPLNFVNNFSQVSRELLEELLDEMKKGDTEEVDAIARDVMENLEKINHHGQRADSIVKSMLQHSRSGNGKKEPTDLNALTDEYLRLAYHGMRARDKSFNANLETDFDPESPEVGVVPQDIGRVLLNLLTNAFHAVNERNRQEPEGYQPTVRVSTRKTGDGVEISVRDNGGGIPDKIRDKIFQPFFTTKPTGEGTGLGLSMSYDIVTKGHGGELTFHNTDGNGTEFIVILPL